MSVGQFAHSRGDAFALCQFGGAIAARSVHKLIRARFPCPVREPVCYLWTVGFVPRLQTYTGKEAPNLLFGFCKTVHALTKLNYNACILLTVNR